MFAQYENAISALKSVNIPPIATCTFILPQGLCSSPTH